MENKFTETVFYDYFEATMTGVGVREEYEVDDRGSKCLDNMYEVADSVNGAFINITSSMNDLENFNVAEGLVLYISQ